MAANKGLKEDEKFVYRISTAEEWEELQRSGATFGGTLDQSTGCFHLSNLNQVPLPLALIFFSSV